MIRTKIPFIDTLATLIFVGVAFFLLRKLTNGNLIIPIAVIAIILLIKLRIDDESRKTHALDQESDGGTRGIHFSNTPQTITLLFKVALVSEAEGEGITGDLLEEANQHSSRLTATIWLYKQVFKSLLPLIYKNLKGRSSPSAPIVERRTFGDRVPRQMVKVNLNCTNCRISITELPFEPRNPEKVLCKACHMANRPERSDRGFGGERGPRQMVSVDLICSGCGTAITALPFVPASDRPIKCRACHAADRARRPSFGGGRY